MQPSTTNGRNRRSRGQVWFALLLAFAFPSHAEKYALLVGIDHYAPERGANNLEGPVNDVTALRQTLVSTWQFKSENIKTLIDADATRKGILDALDGYAASLKPADFFFLFYSGHGTSWFAPGRPQTGIASDTGALVSADLQLIVGNSDLRPRLQRLDGIAQVFAVFDSCYSGNSIKSIAIAPAKYLPPGLFKSIPNVSLAHYDSQFSDFDRFTAASNQYPYRRILYFSAASKAEQAVDIPKLLIAHGHPTVDGLPHGALTDAILKGLRGGADTNHDGKITYEELYEFTRETVSRQFAQTPQFLYPAGDPALPNQPVFSVAQPRFSGMGGLPGGPMAVKVKIEDTASDLRAKVASINGVVVWDSPFDLLIRRGEEGLELYDRSGTLIQRYRAGEDSTLLQRVEAEPQVRKLIDLTYTKQNFNIDLAIQPDGHGFYSLHDHLRFQARPEQDCYLLLLDIDASGMVTVLSPLSVAKIEKLSGGKTVALGKESEVTPPTGTEYLKLFAFRDKPLGFDDLVVEARDAFAPGSSVFEKLMRIVELDVEGRAATQVKLVTTE